MLFPTLGFAVFFLIVFCGHWLLLRWQKMAWKIFILAASWLFYSFWNWRFLGLLILYTVVNYYLSVASFRSGDPPKRRWVVLAIVFNLLLLGIFKYYGFFVVSAYQVCHALGVPCPLPLIFIALPIGISFFSFQAMSYMVDVHRGIIQPAQSLLDFAIYKAFFPQLVAGPIIRAAHYLPQFYDIEKVNRIDVGRAATLILGGLFKKMVIASYLAGNLVDPVFGKSDAFHGLDILLGIYGYAVQIYCDFSGYSDIAIGVAQLLGFNFPENFNMPYMATSCREFWHRWHISFSTWLRDYLFFSLYSLPLGGLRFSAARNYVSIFITFLLGGLWHGAAWTFVMWGALHSVYLAGEAILEGLLIRLRGGRPLPDGPWIRCGQRLLVFHLICVSYVFFRSPSFTEGGLLMWRIVGSWSTTLLTLPVALALVVGFLTQFMDGTRLTPVWNGFNRLPAVAQGFLVALVLTFILAIGPQGVSPFIYFQF